MSRTEADRAARTDPGAADSAVDDSRVQRAVEEYLAALEAGHAPSRDELLGRHPDIAARLGEYLDGLELIHRAGSAVGPLPEGDGSADELAGAEPLGDFLLLRELGRGGMGVVYEALQRSLNRKVALKVLPFAAALDSRQLQRFKTEAQAAACLHHPHIVPVFGVGCERGVHYYAMQLIDGQTLSEMIAGLRQASRHAHPADTTPQAATRTASSTERTRPDRAHFRRVAELGIHTAEALDHAHALGIIHRDIKPGNLLVDGRGGLWVTDFGLAQMQSDARLTMTGDLLGTLRYMSPEQALARRALVDHRTDIYSLGATLYELLTLEPVLAGSDRQELLRQIAFEEPVRPRRINRAIPAELETVVLKALEKDPADRYATAQELAEDLRRFLDDEPIRARPPGVVRRLCKWLRRRPALTTAVVLSLAFVAIALVYRPPPPTPAELARRAEDEYLNLVAPLQQQLRQGQAVSLIGPATRRLPHWWRQGQGHVHVAGQAPDGAMMSVSALGPSLLELIHDTGSPAYRLVVELRHDKILRTAHAGEAAVAFAFSDHITSEGPQCIFARARFADLGPQAAVWKDKAGQPASLFQLGMYLLGASHSGVERTHAFGGPNILYRPAAADWPGPWRRLEIEVRAERIRARHWEGAVVEMAPAIVAPRALRHFRVLFPDLDGIMPPLASRHAVGLFLEGSTVSLRRFDVEPLAEGE